MVTILQDDGSETYETKGGITITRARRETPYEDAISRFIDMMDERRGAVLSSNYEYPGRYTRWDTAIVDPPVGISSFGRNMWIEAYNERGEILLGFIAQHLRTVADITLGDKTQTRIDLTINPPSRVYTEEERSRMPTVFTVLRAITDLFFSTADSALGLYGAFGYDLAFQFDAIDLKLKRPDDQRDMVLFLPDEILVVDNYAAKAWIDRYDFGKDGETTLGKAGDIAPEPFVQTATIPPH
ncbi:MAG: anthranilate synthase, partial [Pseudomonadota bacterium]